MTTPELDQKPLRSMSSILEFWDTVRRECERADRYEMRLSLAVYEIGIKDEKNLLVRQLVRKLSLRVRNMDFIGWFDTSQIGILMPHTPDDGAMKLARDVYYLMTPLTSPPPFTIFTYPSERWPIKKSFTLRLLKLVHYFKTLINPQGITQREELRAHLELELERANRYGHSFSLLIFHVSTIVAQGGNLSTLAKALNSRLRDSDTFGWYGSGDIAAILPYAIHDHTIQIGKTICEMASIPEAESFTAYTYPHQWLTDSPDPNSQNAMTEPSAANKPSPPSLSGGGSERSAHPPPLTETPTTPQNLDPETELLVTDGVGQRERAGSGVNATEVDDFIAKPMPSWKRAMDIVGSIIGIILFSPLFLVAAIGIKLTSPGPILFRQPRVGYKRRPFTLLKFRSMHFDADAEKHRKFMKQLIMRNHDQPNTKLKYDERVFPFGHFLRRTSIDELPQLFNVLKGEMSLVGPRPCMDYEAEEYLQWHSRRFYITPGLTGLWQVSGKNRLSFQQMIRLDIQYVKKFSFWMDVKIILKTFPAGFSIFFEKQV